MKKFFTHTDLIVPTHHPRVLVETAVQQGADRAALLESTDITPPMLESPDARVSYRQFGALVRNALLLTRNPALGIDYGLNVRLSHLGVLGLAVMSSQTVGASLRVALRHYRLLSPAWDLELGVRGARAVISVRETIPLFPFSAFATEGLLAAIGSLGGSLHGAPIPFRALCLAYSRPPYADRYREIADVEAEFDQPLTVIEFDAALLDARVASADPATAALAEQYCEEQAPTSPTVGGLVAQMRRMLAASHGRAPDLGHLARALQTSTRTLRRSLHEMNTSYSELLDQSRRARAEEWVKATPKTFERIAEELGFSNVRSFRRAFKRWTGSTPGALRATRTFTETPALDDGSRSSIG